MRNFQVAIVLALLFSLITACAEKSIQVDQYETFSNYSNQFKILDAKRYSRQYTSGGYKHYDDTVFILLEWSCVNSPSGRCIVGGYEFSLYDTDKGQKIPSVTFNADLVSEFGVPDDSYNCCGRAKNGQVGKMYMFFKVPCYRNLVLRYPDNTGDSEIGAVYYVNLPDGIQCNR